MVPSARQIVRTVVTVVCVALALYLLYLLRKPISWILIAGFLAVALSPPVNVLSRHMRRGFAITITFLGLLAIPIALIALIVPPLITEANDFADNVPQYARDVTKYVKENDRLRKINEDYDITSKLEDEAGKLPNRLGGAAGTLRDVGFGIVNSLFAAITILVLTAFILSNGRNWTDAAIRSRPPEQRERLRRALDNMASAVAGYVAGAMLIALIAGVATYVVLLILGVPFRGSARPDRGAVLADPAGRRDDRRRADRACHGLRGLPDHHDHLGDLGDRLPAVREPRDPAAGAEANGQRAAVHHDRGGSVRRDAARRARRSGGDPDRGLDSDPAARVRRPAHDEHQDDAAGAALRAAHRAAARTPARASVGPAGPGAGLASP